MMLKRYEAQRREPSHPKYPATFPSTSLKDVVCTFCKHKFNVNKELKGNNVPLLLSCGHTTCTSCENANPTRQCTICIDPKDQNEFLDPNRSVEARQQLSYNLYVVGLIHAINARPSCLEDANISFTMPTKTSRNKSNFTIGACSECGRMAHFHCLNCDVMFCSVCFKKIHKKALQDHRAVNLDKNIVDLPIIDSCLNHENEACAYFCDNCNVWACSHCFLGTGIHVGHKAVDQNEKNEEILPEFQGLLEKLEETKLRMHQSLKSLPKTACPEVMNGDWAEKQLTQHFVHLHGILQNLEEHLKTKLSNQMKSRKQYIEDCRNTLENQQEKITSLIELANAAQQNSSNVNLQKLAETLAEYADLPCHIIEKEDKDDNVRLEMKNGIYEIIWDHLELHIPEAPIFDLVKLSELPEGYALEPLETASSIKNLSVCSSATNSVVSMPVEWRSHSSSPTLNDSFVAGFEPPVEKGSSDWVRVIHIIDPTNFYVQRMNDCKQISDLEKDMADSLDKVAPPEEIQLNGVYVVQQSETLRWLRGRVTSIYETEAGNELCDVFFIDYGASESGVLRERIKKPTMCFTLFPGFALHCTLPEIAPMNGTWDENVINSFKNWVYREKLDMHILFENNNLYTVDLRKLAGDLTVHRWLIDTKLAKHTTTEKIQRMNPLSFHQFYYEDLPSDKYTKVIISNIESPNCIYVHKQQDHDYEEKMKSFYYQYMEYLKSDDRTIKDPMPGTTVAVSSTMCTWQRGIITKICEGGSEVHVFFVDYGYTKVVNISLLTYLPSRFCQWNAQAIKISLVDVKPANGEEWSNVDIAYLKKLDNKRAQIIPIRKTEDTYHSVLYVGETNLNAHLVHKEIAISTGRNSKHTSLNKDINIPEKLQTKEIKKAKREPKEKRAKRQKKTTELMKDKPAKKIKELPLLRGPNKRVEESDPYRVRVLIQKVKSPDAIYVSQADKEREYQHMDEQMQIFYDAQTADWSPNLQQNVIYSVWSRKDKKFCRAQIVSEPEPDIKYVKMLLVDLAEEDDIQIELIQPLAPQFLNASKHIFKIKLAGIRPCGGSSVWQSSSCEKLNDIIFDTRDAKYYITLADSNDSEEAMCVNLTIRRDVFTGPTQPNIKETVSVARCLVEAGLALPIRGQIESKELAIELKKKLQLFGSTLEIDTGKLQFKFDDARDNSMDNELDEDKTKQNGHADQDNLDDSNEENPPPHFSTWIPAAHISDKTIDANITYVGYDGEVYFHPSELDDVLDEMSDELYRHYNNRTIKEYDHEWKPGDLCIANYHNDGKWYRGQVLEVGNKQSVKVLFIDYGNVEDCQIGTLKKRIILNEIPILSTKASIVGVQPLGKKWKISDLDVIHHCIVSKKCKIRAITKWPNPWSVAIWIVEGGSYIYFPWYLKNKTQVQCITDDKVQFHIEDEILNKEPEENMLSQLKTPMNNSIRDEQFSSRNNGRDSSEPTISKDSTLDDSISFKMPYEDSESDDSEATLMEEENLTSKIRVHMTHQSDALSHSPSNLSRESSHSKSSSASSLSDKSFTDVQSRAEKEKSSSNSINGSINEIGFPTCNNVDDIDARIENSNGEDDCDEKVLSGNSMSFNIDLDNDFDIKSIKSEALNNNVDDEALGSSTPFCQSVQDLSKIEPQKFDLYTYNIVKFKLGIGMVLPNLRYDGYIVDTSNEELNRWIDMFKRVSEEIQEMAMEFPVISTPAVGQYCIAKYVDEKWYRAIITRIITSMSGKSYEVKFIDFGNLMVTSDVTSFRHYNRKWFEIPEMTIEIKLHNVRAHRNRIKEMHEMMAQVFQESDIFTAVIKKYEPQLEVELFLDESCNNLVYKPLIDKGLLQLID